MFQGAGRNGQGLSRQTQNSLHPRSTTYRRIMEGFDGIYQQRNDRRTLRLQWILQKHPSIHVRATSDAPIRVYAQPERIGIHKGRLVCVLKNKSHSEGNYT